MGNERQVDTGIRRAYSFHVMLKACACCLYYQCCCCYCSATERPCAGGGSEWANHWPAIFRRNRSHFSKARPVFLL